MSADFLIVPNTFLCIFPILNLFGNLFMFLPGNQTKLV